MALVDSELQQILNIKEQIHSAIKDKSVIIPDNTPFADYPQKIADIKGGTSPDDIKIVKFNIDPYQITSSVTMHVTNAISVFQNMAVVEKGATITYYASCDQYEDTTPQTVTVNSDMAILITLHKTSVIYGFSIDQTISDPQLSVSYIKGCDNENYTPSYMNFGLDRYEWNSWDGAFFIGKPCMLNLDGTVDYYLDPNDYTKKMDGTASDIEDTTYEGNVMVEFPPIFIKRENVGDTINVYISNVKVDNDYEAWNCKRADGTYNEHWYFAAYPNILFNSVSRSLSGAQLKTSTSALSTEMNYARANGSGWDMTWWADEDTLRMLFFLMHKGLNSQALLGMSRNNYSSTKDVRGSQNQKGLCYGTDSYSSGSVVKFLGIEYIYWAYSRSCLGILVKDNTYYIKMTKGAQDGSTASDFSEAGTGYINLNMSAPSTNNYSYVSKQTATQYGMFTRSANGTESTYYCDRFSGQYRDTRRAMLSGGNGSGVNGYGISGFDFSTESSSYDGSSCAFLSYHAP